MTARPAEQPSSPAVDGDNRETQNGGGGTYVGLRLSQQVLALISALIAARALGPTGRAQYALPLALSTVVWGVVHLSLDSAASRLLARKEASLDSLVRALSTGVVILALLGTSAAIAIGLAVRHDVLAGASVMGVLYAAAGIGPLLVVQMSETMLLCHGELRIYGLLTSLVALIQLGAVVAIEAIGRLTPETVLAITSGGSLILGVLLCLALRLRCGSRAFLPGREVRLLGALTRVGAVLHPATLSLQLNTRIDLIVVGALVTRRDAGLYSLATTLAGSVFLVSTLIAQTALREQTFRTADVAVSYTIAFARKALHVAVVITPAAMVLAYPAVLLAYGAQWRGAVVPLVILIFATLAFTVEQPIRNMLMRVGQPRAISALAFAGVALNAGATVALTALMGIAGAALGSVIAYWCYTGGILLLMRRDTSVSLRPLLARPARSDPLPRAVNGLVRWVVRRAR